MTLNSKTRLDRYLAGETVDRRPNLTIIGSVVTRYTGIDPEIFGGIDGTVYPRPRTFILGVKANF